MHLLACCQVDILSVYHPSTISSSLRHLTERQLWGSHAPHGSQAQEGPYHCVWVLAPVRQVWKEEFVVLINSYNAPWWLTNHYNDKQADQPPENRINIVHRPEEKRRLQIPPTLLPAQNMCLTSAEKIPFGGFQRQLEPRVLCLQ